jgi:hypothetical protein
MTIQVRILRSYGEMTLPTTLPPDFSRPSKQIASRLKWFPRISQLTLRPVSNVRLKCPSVSALAPHNTEGHLGHC